MYHVRTNEDKHNDVNPCQTDLAKLNQCILITFPKLFAVEPDKLILKGTNSQRTLWKELGEEMCPTRCGNLFEIFSRTRWHWHKDKEINETEINLPIYWDLIDGRCEVADWLGKYFRNCSWSNRLCTMKKLTLDPYLTWYPTSIPDDCKTFIWKPKL